MRLGADHTFRLPGLYKVTVRAGFGNRDTKDEDELDEDFDYEYMYWYIKTEHRITPAVKTNVKLQVFEKDYLTAGLDHEGFLVFNGWDFEVFEDKTHRLWWDLDVEFKAADYRDLAGGDYTREKGEARLSYKRKKNFKISGGIQTNMYEYDDPANDRNRLYAVVSAEKMFRDNDLVIGLHVKYRYTDRQDGDDDSKTSVRAEARLRF
jgi:hypothetical protein